MRGSKTPKPRRVNIMQASIGIDIGKYNHVATAQNWDGQRLDPVAFENNAKGFNRLLQIKENARIRFGVTQVRFALEPTGNYGAALSEWLESRGEEVRMVQPAHTHKAKELEDNSPGKHDVKDSAVVADLDIQGKSLSWLWPQGVFAELRYLTSCRQGLVQDITRERCRLHGVLDLVFPELMGIFKNHIGKGLVALLKKTACPDQIVALGEDKIAELLSQQSRGHLGHDRAAVIVQTARISVGIREGRQALEMELHQILERLEFLRRQLKELERNLKAVLKEVPDKEKLLSIPRMGDISLAAILGETGDIRRYHSAQEIIKLAGLNLYEISSGQYRGVKRISKRGRPLLRQILYMASLRVIQVKGQFCDFYQRLTGKGKPKISAIVAVMCKLIRVLFALARDKQKYDNSTVDMKKVVDCKPNAMVLALN